MSRFFNHLRFKNILTRHIPEPSSFLSITSYPHGFGGTASHSQPGVFRPVSPPLFPSGLPPGEMAAMGSGKNGETIHLETIRSQQTDGHGDNQSGSDLENLIKLSPRSPINLNGSHNAASSTHSTHGSSSYVTQPLLPAGERQSEISPQITKMDSLNSDDCIVSFGTNESAYKVIPPAQSLGTSDDDTTPADYGNRLATLYSNVTGKDIHLLLSSHMYSLSDVGSCRSKQHCTGILVC